MEGVCKKAWTSYNYCRKTYKEVARGLKTDHMHVWNWSLICPGRNTGGHLQRATCGRKSVFSTISTRREGSRSHIAPFLHRCSLSWYPHASPSSQTSSSLQSQLRPDDGLSSLSLFSYTTLTSRSQSSSGCGWLACSIKSRAVSTCMHAIIGA